VDCQDVRDDLEAYALGALDDEDVRRVEAHLPACVDCSEVVRAYRLAVDHLALAVPIYRAPSRIKPRLLSSVGSGRTFMLPRILTTRWALGTAAAFLIALAVGGTAWAIVLSSQVERLRDDNARLAELTQLDAEQRAALLRLQSDLSTARTEQRRLSTTLEEQATLLVLALDPDLLPTELQGTSLAPTARCGYVWSTMQSVGALTCTDLPSTAFTLTYELWVTKGDKTIALGTFLPRTDGSAQLLVKFPEDADGPVSNMWVTLEQQLGPSRSRPSAEVILQRAPDNQAAR
jgi:hypothetical protein